MVKGGSDLRGEGKAPPLSGGNVKEFAHLYPCFICYTVLWIVVRIGKVSRGHLAMRMKQNTFNDVNYDEDDDKERP